MTKHKKKHKKKLNKRNMSIEHKHKLNYIYTLSDQFTPVRKLCFNEMNHSIHDQLVTILKNDGIQNGAHLVTWNMEYGRSGTNPIGEIDVLEYFAPWNALALYEVKSTPSSNLLSKGKQQLNRMIDRYLNIFDKDFELPLDVVYTFLVNNNKHNSLDYRIHQHREVKL